MTHEMELLLACLRKEEWKAKLVKLQSYSEQDWETVLEAASQQAVVPILYNTLKPLYYDLNIPDHILTKMHNIYYNSAARNMRIYKELTKNTALFNNDGISIILLKGSHLAEFVYGNLALRPFLDIDLLAKIDDLPRIHKVLTDNGYKTIEENQGSYLEHMAPYFKENSLKIDVHFHITRPPISQNVDIATLWERAQKKSLNGSCVMTLCPEDLFLHLCTHTGIHHGFDNGLTPYFDICYILEHHRDELNWEELLLRANEWGLSRCVYLMLAMTEKTIGLPIPEQIRQTFKPEPNTQSALEAAENIILGSIMDDLPLVSPYISRLFSRQDWRSKYNYFFMRAFPPSETMLIEKPKNKSIKNLKAYWLYLQRARNLLKKHGKTIWLGLRKDSRTLLALEAENKRNDLRDWLTKGKSN